MDDLNHSFNLFGSDRPCSALFSEQVHDVGGELVASLVILLQLLVVNVPNLSEFRSVVGMFDCGFGGRRGGGCRSRASSSSLLWT